MFSTLDYNMWSNEGKLKSRYPSVATNNDVTTKLLEKRIAKVNKNPLLSLKQSDSYTDVNSSTKTRKTRVIKSSPVGAKLKNKDRIGIRQTSSDVLVVSETDIHLRRKPKKTKKDAKPYPGKLYREKMFGVCSSPSTSDYDRPANIPRRRLQVEDSDPLDRGYVSDVKSETSRSYYKEREEFNVERIIRPKSAGQALYAADSDDDSSLEGEIEVIDIDDDDAFIVIKDSSIDHSSEAYIKEASDSHTTGNVIESRKTQGNSIRTNRYHGKSDNTGKYSEPFSLSDSEKRDGKAHLKNNSNKYSSSENTLLAPSSFDRRRVRSDSSAIPVKDSYVDKRRESETMQRNIENELHIAKANTVNNRRPSNTKTDVSNPEMSTDKTYAKAVEKVLTKYSNMSIRAGDKGSDSNQPGRPMARPGDNHLGPRQRASLPRKLKPLLNREKLGHVNQKSGEIDHRVPFS